MLVWFYTSEVIIFPREHHWKHSFLLWISGLLYIIVCKHLVIVTGNGALRTEATSLQCNSTLFGKYRCSVSYDTSHFIIWAVLRKKGHFDTSKSKDSYTFLYLINWITKSTIANRASLDQMPHQRHVWSWYPLFVLSLCSLWHDTGHIEIL